MISHIARIANMSKDQEMRYGFLLTSVFEEEWAFNLVKKLEVVP